MQLGVKPVSGFWLNLDDFMLFKYRKQLALGQLQPLSQRGEFLAQFIIDIFQRPAQIIMHRQQITRQFGAAISFGLAPVTLAAFAHVFGFGHGAHQPVFQLAVFILQLFQAWRLQIGQLLLLHFGFNLVDIVQKVVFFVAHLNLPLSCRAGNQPPHQLRRVIHDRNNTRIIQMGRADDTYRANNFSLTVHIGRNHQRGTRK